MRRKVLDAVLSCLDEGLVQSSIPDIAARAGVAPSSIYRRWETRENLVAEALLTESDESIPVPDTGAIRSDLIGFAEGLAAFLASRRGTAILRAMMMIEWSEELSELRTRFWDQRFAASSVMIQRGIDRGELAPGTDARLFLQMLIAPLHLRHLLLGGDPATAIAEQVDLLLAGAGRTP
ncbi:TetR/AcrR family transcriptional regulator [Dietzia sp. SYD-A1]|uniref:TetR/AcrR family transcriptional regulator n=1 Tax=Dietzia sp. SYD-A1 TaxID=2780141 RepID=UPI001891C9B9|nr:TetR/AcrR family transcriptional regulator [Dietzia sp. SYD-A1]